MRWYLFTIVIKRTNAFSSTACSDCAEGIRQVHKFIWCDMYILDPRTATKNGRRMHLISKIIYLQNIYRSYESTNNLSSYEYEFLPVFFISRKNINHFVANFSPFLDQISYHFWLLSWDTSWLQPTNYSSWNHLRKVLNPIRNRLERTSILSMESSGPHYQCFWVGQSAFGTKHL